jgi:NAD+ synthase (glutamine-hydrolysing)
MPGSDYMMVADLDLGRVRYDRLHASAFREAAARFAPEYEAVPLGISLAASDGALLEPNRLPFIPEGKAAREVRCAEIFDIQANALARRLSIVGGKAVIGISGGLDSTLAVLVAVRAMEILELPATNITAVTMPCFGTSDETLQNALELMSALGVTTRTVPIKDAVLQHFKDIGHDVHDFSVTYENAQARIRTLVLMDLANKYNGLVVGTGDMSELALGWATYCGDHMSMYGVNAGVPKTLVRYMVRHAAENIFGERLREILLDVIDTPVSPELLPTDEDGNIAQITEDKVGPYELHDFFMYYYLRYGFTREKIAYMANMAFDGVYSEDVINRWLNVFMRRFFTQQFKRSCLPDGPKVVGVSLSPRGDLRMPSDVCGI